MRKSQRQRRRQRTRPKETFLSSIVGEFIDPIDALLTIFYSILFALLFTLSYSVLIYRGVAASCRSSSSICQPGAADYSE
jgi:hypothetical protein